MTSYIGITIGPIVSTMLLTSTPAGLWAASYMFSELSKRICLKLPKKSIITPQFPDGEPETKGVGLFPDRIIFKAEGLPFKDIQPLIVEAIGEVAELLCMQGQSVPAMQSYLRDYIQVHAVAFDTNETPIFHSRNFLAAAEMERSFAQKDDGTLFAQFEWRDREKEDDEKEETEEEKNTGSKSRAVKNSTLVKSLKQNWPLWQNPEQQKQIRDLADIASNGKADYDETKNEYKFGKLLKKYRYYAVIQADGDNVGTAIGSLPAGEIEDFSKKCWEYSMAAAGIIRDYGGVPIYLGGDDLLALAPVENDRKQTIFFLLQDLRAAFKVAFGDDLIKKHSLALSFGVSIQYYKHPLYESFALAYHLLQEHAKKGNKNAIALRLQKHSGQSVDLLFSDGESALLTELTQQIDDLLKTQEEHDSTNLLLHSIMTHLRTQEAVFTAALSSNNLKNTFKNVFRDSYVKQPKPFDDAQKLLELCAEQPEPLKVTDKLLRLLKFFVEEGDDRA